MSARLGPARLWLVVALCLLFASAAPPAADAEQASPASLNFAFQRGSAQVGDHLHLTATLRSQGQDPVFGTIVKLSLSPGLQLLSADPSSASLGTWSVPRIDPAGSEKLDLLVAVTAPGTQTASVDITEGSPFLDGHASASLDAQDNPAPVISKLAMKDGRFRFSLSEPSTVSFAIQHRPDRHTRFVERRFGAGAQALHVTLAPGRYRAALVPTDSQGRQGRTRYVSFTA